MSERKIKLESIILEAYGCKDVHDFQKSNDVSIQMIKEICIEACRQTLELAAENANLLNSKGEITGGISVDEYEDELSWRKIVVDYIVNKQSILNTINQVE